MELVIVKVLSDLFGTKSRQEASCNAENRQTQPVSAEQVKQPVQSAFVKTAGQPVLVKEPKDLGTTELPRPDDVSWLDNAQKVAVAIDILKHHEGGLSYYWKKYYAERKPVEDIVFEQEQRCYDSLWRDMRKCWKILRSPFGSAYLAGHFPSPQLAQGNPELAKEICVMDVEELERWQLDSLLEDGVYTLGILRNSLLNNHWQLPDITARDKWYFRKVLVQYGLEMPPTDEPDPIPFAELYIGEVFGVEVTPEKRLSSYGFIQGAELLEDRVRRIQENGFVREYTIDGCKKTLFYLHSDDNEISLKWRLRDARRNLKVRKILAGGNYPEVRSAIVEGVDLEELDKVFVKDLDLSARARRKVREEFCGDVTLAELIRAYHEGLIYDDSVTATEVKEYLYQHNYVIRPENMPMDERTHIAYLGLPTRIRMNLRYPGCVETVDDLVRCCAGDDVVFSVRHLDGIGKRSMETIRARLTELGFLVDS